MATDYAALNATQHVAETDSFTAERYHQFARHLAPSAKKILDVGCSTGRGGEALKTLRPDCSIHGFDCLQSRLDRLPPAYAAGICGITTEIPAETATFDAIVAGEFIEHLTYADAIATLREFRRVLVPDGQLLMTTPYPDYFKLALTGRSTVGGAHLSAHYPKQLAVMMEECGFRDMRYCGSGRVSRYLGEHFPLMQAYGSFLIVGVAGSKKIAMS